VKIDTGNIGGPSAGLPFALDLMEKLGRDVDHGHRVAATGELGLDGSVNAIGGIKQKTLGARDADVEVFLVPVDNAAEARQYAGDMRIIPVRTVREAVRALAALPRTNAPSG
jgi:PDZ domain-containing protein